MARLRITPALAPESSEIIIGRGLPDPLLPPRASREKTVVLSSPGALRAAKDAAARSGATDPLVLPDREEAKSFTVLRRVYEWLGELGIGRHDTILAVGGGAATDLAGFAAGQVEHVTLGTPAKPGTFAPPNANGENTSESK